MSEPVSNSYKLHTCENCHHSIWDREGCYCNRVIAEMHKVDENDTCERWEEEKDIADNGYFDAEPCNADP